MTNYQSGDVSRLFGAPRATAAAPGKANLFQDERFGASAGRKASSTDAMVEALRAARKAAEAERKEAAAVEDATAAEAPAAAASREEGATPTPTQTRRTKPRKPRSEAKVGEAATNARAAATPEPAAAASAPREDHPERTLFVGNLPAQVRPKKVKQLMRQFGAVESVRVRSLAIDGAKVDEAGNQDLVRRVASYKRSLDLGLKQSCNAYVVFSSEESVLRAVEADGLEFEERHLRLDRVGKYRGVAGMGDGLFDASLSLFLGNMPWDADEEALRGKFDELLREGHGDGAVKGVRIIRDRETMKGKGFGYVLFRSKAIVADALRLDGLKFGGRKLRLKVCGRRFKERKSGGVNAPAFEGRRAELSGAARRVKGKRKASGLPAIAFKKKKKKAKASK